MQNCSFCDRESLKHQIITESDDFIVIQARRPLAKGHVMVIPKQHINSFQLSESASIEMLKLIQKLFDTCKEVLGATGMNVFSNIGESAGQTVPHLHFHIVSRFDNDESPFKILNDIEKYKALKQLTEEEIKERVMILNSAN